MKDKTRYSLVFIFFFIVLFLAGATQHLLHLNVTRNMSHCVSELYILNMSNIMYLDCAFTFSHHYFLLSV